MGDKLALLLEKEQQLKYRIQKEKAKLSLRRRKERTGKLIAWGVVVEQMIKDEEESLTPEKWRLQCERFLNGRTLERALVGELAGVDVDE